MYVSMTAIQADVLVSNKVNIPGGNKNYLVIHKSNIFRHSHVQPIRSYMPKHLNV